MLNSTSGPERNYVQAMIILNFDNFEQFRDVWPAVQVKLSTWSTLRYMLVSPHHLLRGTGSLSGAFLDSRPSPWSSLFNATLFVSDLCYVVPVHSGFLMLL